MLTAPVPEPRAWRGRALAASEYPLRIPDDCAAELDGVARELRRAEDDREPERRRHLVRLWLRAGDRRQFRG